MKNLINMLVILLIALFVVGCSPDTESKNESKSTSEDSTKSEESGAVPESKKSENPLQDVMEAYPDVQSKWRNLPTDFQKRVIVPQLNTIPFQVDTVSVFTLATGVLPPGVKTNFDIIFKSKNSFPRLHVTAFDVDGQEPTFGDFTSKAELESDIEGYYTENKKDKEISWLSEDEKIRYLVKYMEGESKEISITKEQLIKIANSMIEQTK
ncbi:hypothetical protein VBD025_10860 [Virgibacillus flavescens]|uniref:hypothetical protein n=1 Tax=Virgibacillus flavescens TaxID=1611422 RepID=UPI003D34B246